MDLGIQFKISDGRSRAPVIAIAPERRGFILSDLEVWLVKRLISFPLEAAAF